MDLEEKERVQSIGTLAEKEMTRLLKKGIGP